MVGRRNQSELLSFLPILAIFGQMVGILLKFESFEPYKSHFGAFYGWFCGFFVVFGVSCRIYRSSRMKACRCGLEMLHASSRLRACLAKVLRGVVWVLRQVLCGSHGVCASLSIGWGWQGGGSEGVWGDKGAAPPRGYAPPHAVWG